MTPEEDAFNELCGYTLTHRDPAFIHQHVVDAFAVQQADVTTKPIKLTFGLLGLYLRVERRFSGKQVQLAHMALARYKQVWPAFTLPRERGAITPRTVMSSPEGPARDEAIDAWCASVWEAFRENRQTIVDLLVQHRIIGRPPSSP